MDKDGDGLISLEEYIGEYLGNYLDDMGAEGEFTSSQATQ